MTSYELKAKTKIDEIGAEAYVYEHKKTGAKVFTLSCDDENKVFAIGFRTPVDDSTGVAHIIEHSVLCGSEKYPCKDPFVELVKGSLNTFLNAMTYPDKTVYPVASCNDKDFANLMDVYLDAVFHPNIYREEKIFKQEGWHYELEDAEGELTCNGVVYNEMKGVYSSFDGVMEAATMKVLFPDHSYGEESGGDPEVIPELTYGQFMDFHRRYYHPSNSYIYLYGNMDMEATLEKIDADYLSKYDRIEIDSEIKACPEIKANADVSFEYSISESEDEADKTALSVCWKVGGELDPVRYTALQILDYIMLGVPGAPIQEALIKAGIGDDISGGYCNGIRDPYFGIVARNTEASRKEEFLQIIHDTFKAQADGELDHEAIRAAINVYEFRAREADYGAYPKGLMYGLQSFDSWLYDADPTMHLRYAWVFDELKKKLEEGYFEELIRECFLGRDAGCGDAGCGDAGCGDAGCEDGEVAGKVKSAVITFVPKKGLAAEREKLVKEKLSKIKESLSSEEIEQIIQETKELKAYQAEPSKEEDLLKIPMLKREDIERKAPEYDGRLVERKGIKFFASNVFTSGIAYLKFAFDLKNLEPEEIAYAQILIDVLGYIDTDRHTYAQQATLTNLNSGGIGFSLESFNDADDYNKCTFILAANAKVLYDKIGFACDTIEEMLFESKLSDVDRLNDIVSESRAKTREAILCSGHQTALNYAGSMLSTDRWFSDQTRGIGFYRLMEEIDVDSLPAKLTGLCEKIFTKDNLLVNVISENCDGIIDEIAGKLGAGHWAQMEDEWSGEAAGCSDAEVGGACGSTVGCGDAEVGGASGSETGCSGETRENRFLTTPCVPTAFACASQVNYNARFGNFRKHGFETNGALNVLRVILNYNYLWNNIRVLGGAYGCSSVFGKSGACGFSSYRDPNLTKTDDIFKAVTEFVGNYDCDEREMTKSVIGCMSDVDAPASPLIKGLRALNDYYSHVTQEMRQKSRDEILDVTPEKIRNLKGLIQAAMDDSVSCSIGNENLIKENAAAFTVVEPLYRK